MKAPSIMCPLPWVTDKHAKPGAVYCDDATGGIVADCGPFTFAAWNLDTVRRNGAYIAHACNAYPELVGVIALHLRAAGEDHGGRFRALLAQLGESIAASPHEADNQLTDPVGQAPGAAETGTASATAARAVPQQASDPGAPAEAAVCKPKSRLFAGVTDYQYKRAFGTLQMLRAAHPSYRDDELLLYTLATRLRSAD